MLPDFPKTRQELDEAIRHQIDTRAREKSVITSLMGGITQHEGRLHSFDQEGTGTVTQDYENLGFPFQLSFEEIPDLMGEKLEAKIDAISSELAQRMSEFAYKTIQESVDSVGNSIDAKGGPFTQEMALEMWDRVQWTPSSVFIAHPVMAKALGEKWIEWQKDRAFMKKFNEVDRRKKEEWRDRESDRKLVR